MIKISVVVATFNRALLLENLIEALAHQSIGVENFEVIIVDDGSQDQTSKIIAKNAVLFDHFQTLKTRNGGPAKARNLGIRLAKANIIAFTDDDCIPAEDWLQTILEVFENDSEVVGVQGSTYTKRAEVNLLTHQIDNVRGNASVPTCNAAYKKEILETVGGFDIHFPFPHNEDADLAWKVMSIGKITFNPKMQVYHPVRQDSYSKLSNRMRYLASEFLLFYKHPSQYRKFRAFHPWFNIYFNVFFRSQYYNLRLTLKYVLQPKIFIPSIKLLFTWWIKLIKLYPYFRHAQIQAKSISNYSK